MSTHLTLVSICVPTYKHKDWLTQCLKTLANQKTRFKYEILVGIEYDDNESIKYIPSKLTNKNAEIRVLENPEKNIIYIGGKRTGRGNFLNLLKESTGKYLALCEGDDYWTDPKKLEKEVRFLEDNKGINYVFTNNQVLDPEGTLTLNDKNLPYKFDLRFLLIKNIMPHTSTIMFRRKLIKFPLNQIFYTSFNGDWVLLFILTHSGNIGFINESTTIHRKGVGIISKTNNKLKFLNGLQTNIKLNKMTNGKYNFHLGKIEWHLKNIAFACFQEKDLLKGIYYFFWKIIRSLKENKFNSNIISNNFVFFKHSVKLVFNKKT